MGEMKSAFERAMERADRVGRLTSEEMGKHRQERCVPAGRAIAERYLEHGHEKLLKEDVGKYTADDKLIVSKATQSRLVEAVSLTDYEKTERALNGLLSLCGEQGEEVIGGKVDEIARLLEEFARELKLKYEAEKENIQQGDRELLHQLRISGSAIGEVNMAASETWGRIYLEFIAPYRERLESLKSELVALLDKVEQ